MKDVTCDDVFELEPVDLSGVDNPLLDQETYQALEDAVKGLFALGMLYVGVMIFKSLLESEKNGECSVL